MAQEKNGTEIKFDDPKMEELWEEIKLAAIHQEELRQRVENMGLQNMEKDPEARKAQAAILRLTEAEYMRATQDVRRAQAAFAQYAPSKK